MLVLGRVYNLYNLNNQGFFTGFHDKSTPLPTPQRGFSSPWPKCPPSPADGYGIGYGYGRMCLKNQKQVPSTMAEALMYLKEQLFSTMVWPSRFAPCCSVDKVQTLSVIPCWWTNKNYTSKDGEYPWISHHILRDCSFFCENKTHRMHVWYIYLHLPYEWTKCR